MADDAITYINQLQGRPHPSKPFFIYYVPGGTHAPHQPTPEWIAKFKGKFDMGWNALRDSIFANQKRLGVIPANTQLTPVAGRPAEVGHADCPRRRSSSPGRWRSSPPTWPTPTTRSAGSSRRSRTCGKLDNTLIIYIEGDNGTSAEGSTIGTPNRRGVASRASNMPVAEQMKYYDVWGSDET